MRLKWLLCRPNAISALCRVPVFVRRGLGVCVQFPSINLKCICIVYPLCGFFTALIFFSHYTCVMQDRTCSLIQTQCAWLSACGSILHAQATATQYTYSVEVLSAAVLCPQQLIVLSSIPVRLAVLLFYVAFQCDARGLISNCSGQQDGFGAWMEFWQKKSDMLQHARSTAILSGIWTGFDTP